MQPAEEFSTLVHKIGHEMLHRGDRRTLTTKQVRETEAEAVAFVVCQAAGSQTGTASQDYIQLWHGDADLLRESLEAVQHTEDKYEVIAGARRLRAAKLAELPSIPVRIVKLTDAEAIEAQCIEDLQREDIHSMEETPGFKSLLELGQPYTVGHVAAGLGTPAVIIGVHP